MNKNTIRIYHKDKYAFYGSCYYLYVNNRSYLYTPNNTIKILHNPRIEINNDIIDSYVESRGFEKALQMDGMKINFYNGYEKKISDIKLMLKSVELSMKDRYKYSIINTESLVSIIQLHKLIQKLG